MDVDRAREHGDEHNTIVIDRGHPGNGKVRVLVADDNVVADSKDDAGAGVADGRVRQALSVRAEIVNPQIPRHHESIVRRGARDGHVRPGFGTAGSKHPSSRCRVGSSRSGRTMS